MQTTDPVSKTVVATTPKGDLFARPDALPAVPTLGAHPTYQAGTATDPCVGITFEQLAGESSPGVTFITQPASGGSFGPYSLYHFARTGKPA